MKIQEKPDYLIFADSAKKGEVSDFPDVSRGWGITIEQTGSKPPMEWMNGAFNRVDKNMLYLLQQGVPEWCESVKYPVNAIIKYNGVLYTAIAENDNSNPATSSTKWKKTQEEVSKASTTQNGIVKLSSATNSTSETEAATPLAVKKVNDIADDANTKAQQAFELVQTMTPNSRKINNKSLDNDVSLNANDVGAIPAQKNNDNDYFTPSNLNFALRPRVNNSPVVTIDQFTDYKNPTIGWYALPSGYIHQFGTVILPPIEEYNVVTISGIKYYTQVYKILLPRSYPTAQVATTVTLVGSPFNGQQANEFGVWARNNRGSDGVNSGVSKSSFDVSITSKALGYVPVIHFSSDGY